MARAGQLLQHPDSLTIESPEGIEVIVGFPLAFFFLGLSLFSFPLLVI